MFGSGKNRCKICEMVSGARKVNVIMENEHVIAFVEPDAAEVGGVVVTTKKHYCDLDELDDVTADALMRALRAVTGALKAAFAPDATGMLQNSGKFKDQLHFHIHVFPRFRHDWLRGLASDIPSPVWSNMEGIADELKKHLN